jgi:hypothetical protein
MKRRAKLIPMLRVENLLQSVLKSASLLQNFDRSRLSLFALREE